MKKRAVAAFTNLALALIVIALGAVCFLPAVAPASEVDDRVRFRGNSEDGVSLMFNVYWGTDEVYGILDILDEYGARATFFLGGCWADDNVACVREISRRGHEIGTHGYFHKEHDKLSLKENSDELRTSKEFLTLASGQEIVLFAPPSGAYNGDTLTAAEGLGLTTVMWTKDTIDWRDKDEQLCFSRATADVKGGDFILLHPMEHTVRALPRILREYKRQGLRAITVGENLG